jgi:toxin ParE1/3/4
VVRVVLSPAARADLADIRVYSVEQFSPSVADAYFLGFDAVFDLLSAQPAAGQAHPELGLGIRCFRHRRHRLFYVFDSELVLIVRVIHYARRVRRADVRRAQ